MGNKIIIEPCVDIKTGEGENNLGKLIMNVRDDLFTEMIDLWHSSYGDETPVHEFIGLTKEEYEKFVEGWI